MPPIHIPIHALYHCLSGVLVHWVTATWSLHPYTIQGVSLRCRTSGSEGKSFLFKELNTLVGGGVALPLVGHGGSPMWMASRECSIPIHMTRPWGPPKNNAVFII